ncbi:MAG: MarR family transcriptional regulator [Solirubrobacteraceae bacterium]
MAKYKRKRLISAISDELRESQNQTDRLDEAAAGLLQINRTDHRCIDILERNGAMTAGELSAASGLTTGAITAVLDRLEKRGYAVRARDSADRRRVLVKLTTKARELDREIYEPLGQDYAKQIERYTTDELVLIHDFMRRSKELGAKHLERIKALMLSAGAESEQ